MSLFRIVLKTCFSLVLKYGSGLFSQKLIEPNFVELSLSQDEPMSDCVSLFAFNCPGAIVCPNLCIELLLVSVESLQHKGAAAVPKGCTQKYVELQYVSNSPSQKTNAALLLSAGDKEAMQTLCV